MISKCGRVWRWIGAPSKPGKDVQGMDWDVLQVWKGMGMDWDDL